MQTELNNLAAYVKHMRHNGFNNKQIQLVTKLPQSVISRIINNHTYKSVSHADIERSSVIEDRIHVLNLLLECHEITGGMGLDDNNKLYIQILKGVGTDFDKVKELYYDISKKALRNVWTYYSGSIAHFNSAQLNLNIEDILDLLKETEDV